MNIQAYADDLVLLSPSSSGLQKLLGRAGELLAEEGLLLNVRKTVAMVFRPKPLSSDDHMKLTFYDKSIDFVDSFKYLGCILSKSFTDYCDIDRCYKSFNRSAGFLLRKFNFTDTNILFSLFNSYCSSFYGCEL